MEEVPVYVEPPRPVNDGERVLVYLRRVPCEGEWIQFDEDFPNEFLAGHGAKVKHVHWPIERLAPGINSPPIVRLERG